MYLVIDVGGTFIKYALMNEEGEIAEKGKVKTPNKPSDTVDTFVETIAGIYANVKGNLDSKLPGKGVSGSEQSDSGRTEGTLIIEGIAMDLPGQIDVENGIVYGGGALRYMHDIPLERLVSERCDNVRVSLENDAKAAALAEVWKGNAKDVSDACILIFGTGIGGAVIKDRRVHRGKHLLAGEVSFAIDEMTLDDVKKIRPIEGMDIMEAVDEVPYFWSAHASTASMCHELAKKLSLEDDEVTGELVYKWASEGNELAINALEEVYFSIAKQCLNLYVIFDPEVILIGGGISAEPKFLEGIKRYVDKIKTISLVYEKITLDVCKYRNDSNLIGALYNFKQKYE